MRIPHALENVIKVLGVDGSDKQCDNIKTKVILILMGKADEQGYRFVTISFLIPYNFLFILNNFIVYCFFYGSYRETRDQKLLDLRDMIHEIVQRDTLKSECFIFIFLEKKI
jgi:hypothetical protein